VIGPWCGNMPGLPTTVRVLLSVCAHCINATAPARRTNAMMANCQAGGPGRVLLAEPRADPSEDDDQVVMEVGLAVD
jgi:hypothetical protein